MPEGDSWKKIGMSQIFTDVGQAIPVTVIEAGPCIVVQIKNSTLKMAIMPFRLVLARRENVFF